MKVLVGRCFLLVNCEINKNWNKIGLLHCIINVLSFIVIFIIKFMPPHFLFFFFSSYPPSFLLFTSFSSASYYLPKGNHNKHRLRAFPFIPFFLLLSSSSILFLHFLCLFFYFFFFCFSLLWIFIYLSIFLERRFFRKTYNQIKNLFSICRRLITK